MSLRRTPENIPLQRTTYIHDWVVLPICMVAGFVATSTTGCAPTTGGAGGGGNTANQNSVTATNDNDSPEPDEMTGNGNSTNANTNEPDVPMENANANESVDSQNDNMINDDLTLGPCCLPDGTCTLAVREQCNGAFVGGGAACSATSCVASPFVDEAMQRGIVYTALFPRGEPDVVPGSGIAFADFDGDEDIDMMVLGKIGDGMVGVFENDGRGYFTDRSADSGIVPNTLMRGVAAGDYDADGDLDVYLSFWTVPNALMRNDGDFHFTDVTAEAGVANTGKASGCSWGDYDGDGWLDLAVSDYGIDDLPNRLFHNLGNGAFEEVGAAKGVTTGRRSMQVTFFDYDTDGDMDLYVANDLMGFLCPTCCNEMYRNDNGNFTHLPDESGANVCLNSMTITIGDVNNDLNLDMFFTDDSLPPGNILILGQGDDRFVDASTEAGVNPMGSIGWGAVFFDYDNNGHEDLYVTYNVSVNEFYVNNGAFPLTESAFEAGLDIRGQSYCVAVADIDDDGDQDLALWDRQKNIHLFVNKEGQKRRWVKFRMIGEGRNTHAVGATVSISAGGLDQVRHLVAGANLKSQDSNILHFGLNLERIVDEIRILWPGGTGRTLQNYPGNQTWKLYPPSRLGDADGDGAVGAEDREFLTACMGQVRPGCEMMDLDGDGDVDAADAAAQ
jgi:hypothetical protein